MTRYVESLNAALHELFARDERVMIVGEDLVDPYGGAFKVSRGLSTRFPDRVITTPVAEAGIVGLGTGLALRGMRPIVEIMFGDFLALACDQIVNSAAKFRSMYNGQVSVPLVIRTPMGGRRGYGPTHSQTLEPLFFNVPGLTIVAPSHLHDPGAALTAIVGRTETPVLFIENKLLYSTELHDPAMADFDVFHVERLDGDSGLETVRASIRGSESADAVVVAYGGMAPIAMEAMKTLFMRHEIAVRLYVPAVIKPFPANVLAAIAAERRPVVVAEESPGYGGWGAEVLAQLAERNSGAPVRRVGADETTIPASRELEDGMLPQADDIVAAVRGVLDVH